MCYPRHSILGQLYSQRQTEILLDKSEKDLVIEALKNLQSDNMTSSPFMSTSHEERVEKITALQKLIVKLN